MEQFQRFAILLTIWGLIQSGLVYAVDRNPVPTVRWFFIFIAVSGGFLGAFHVVFKLRMWMFIHVGVYQRWALARFAHRKTGIIPPLSGVMLGIAGTLVGPIFGICHSQLFGPQASGFHAACVGMGVGIVGFSIVGVIVFAVINHFRRRATVRSDWG